MPAFFLFARVDGIHDCDGSHGIYSFEEDEVASKVNEALRKRPSTK
jgi:hypothetical protein